MKIGLDLDGVAFDFVSNFRDYLTTHRGADPARLPDPDTWQVWDSWGMTEDAWMAAFNAGVCGGHLFSGVRYLYPGAVDAVKQWVNDGHDVVAITHRPGDAVERTLAWLAEVGLPDLPVTFTADKAAVGVDVIVEDNVDNALAVIKAGGRAVLIDRPWNRRWSLCDGHTVSVDNLPASRTGRLQRAYGWWNKTDGGVVELVDKIDKTGTGLPRHDFEGGQRAHDVEELEAPFAGGVLSGPRSIVEKVVAEVRVTSDTGGQKGSKPEQVAQIPPRFLMELGRVYATGADKYPDAEPGRPNWSRGYAWSLSYNALHRHLAAMWGGEWYDPEDGLPHIVKVAWHAATLYTFHGEGLGVDDRPTYYEATS